MKNASFNFKGDIPHASSVTKHGGACVANSQGVQGILRIGRFLRSCYRLRSISLALWVDAYDNFKPTHGK